jgi:hypothetical protein
MAKLLGVCGVSLLTVAVFMTAPAFAQEGPGGSINPGRDCQTITTCQFKKGGSYRGCVSSYSCRVCNYVAAPCKIAGAKGRVCRTSVCTWGG